MLSIGVEKHVYLLITPRPSNCMGVWALISLSEFTEVNFALTEPISGLCNRLELQYLPQQSLL